MHATQAQVARRESTIIHERQSRHQMRKRNWTGLKGEESQRSEFTRVTGYLNSAGQETLATLEITRIQLHTKAILTPRAIVL